MMRKPKNGSSTGGRSSRRERSLSPGKPPSRLVGDDQAAEIGDGDLEAVPLGLLVGNGEEHERHRPFGACLPPALDRRELGRLVTVDVAARLVAEEELERQQNHRHAEPHLEHGHGVRRLDAGEEVPRTGGDDDEGGSQVRRRHHVDEAHREGRVEDDREPVDRIGDAVAHDVAGRDTASRNSPTGSRRPRTACRPRRGSPPSHAVPAAPGSSRRGGCRGTSPRGRRRSAPRSRSAVRRRCRRCARIRSSWCRTGTRARCRRRRPWRRRRRRCASRTAPARDSEFHPSAATGRAASRSTPRGRW